MQNKGARPKSSFEEERLAYEKFRAANPCRTFIEIPEGLTAAEAVRALLAALADKYEAEHA